MKCVSIAIYNGNSRENQPTKQEVGNPGIFKIPGFWGF
jgi:hypothetical protein